MSKKSNSKKFKMHTPGGIVIPFETADQIVRASLEEHRDYLKSELKQ